MVWVFVGGKYISKDVVDDEQMEIVLRVILVGEG
jgi:hypothetical protein